MTVEAETLVPGLATGPVCALAPLSFWGGFDPIDGFVTDRSHPAHGMSLRGCILVMRAGRGSSSSSSVLAEAIRLGTAPIGIVLAESDPVIAVGALVAAALYGIACPVVVVSPEDHSLLAREASLRIEAGDTGARVIVP